MPDSRDFHSWFWSIASIPLFAEKLEEQINRLLLVTEEVHFLPTARTDPPPATHERHFTEECRLDSERIEPCHVFLRLDTLNIKVIRLCDHGRIFADRTPCVQRDV
jgi:hypothetical protein